jgi:hypothetical protein
MMNRAVAASVAHAAKADFACSLDKWAEITICHYLLMTIIALVQFTRWRQLVFLFLFEDEQLRTLTEAMMARLISSFSNSSMIQVSLGWPNSGDHPLGRGSCGSVSKAYADPMAEKELRAPASRTRIGFLVRPRQVQCQVMPTEARRQRHDAWRQHHCRGG